MPAAENFTDLHYPKGGIDLSRAAQSQPWRPGPPRPGGEPTRIYTSAEIVNARSFDARLRRFRGGSRVGLKRYMPVPVINSQLIQHLNTVVGVTPGAAVQGSLLGRIVTGIAVCQGRVFSFEPGGTEYTEATNNSSTEPPLNFSGVLMSAPNNQDLFFVDGTHYRYYSPLDPVNTVEDWTAAQGALPQDDAPNTHQKARLICTWRGRTVLSGLIDDSQNWFMSKVSAPRNWDYSPTSQTATQAVAGNNSRLGYIGDTITALMAYNDDILLCGGNTSIYAIRGDPMMGGEIDLVTNSIGVAYGQAFTQDPKGVIYFMSNAGSIYAMAPNQQPERISSPIDSIIQGLNTGEQYVRLEWSERERGCHVFITTLVAATQTDEHFFWEGQSNSWSKTRFKNKRHNPLASCTIDGNAPNDRVVLIGSWDGYVRSFDPDQTTDDGEDIESEVWIGPLLTKDFDEVKLKSIQAVLGADSGEVTCTIHTGSTAEEALESEATDEPFIFGAGRNLSELVRASGHAIYLKLTSTNRWALEAIRAAMSPNMSKVRRRGA